MYSNLLIAMKSKSITMIQIGNLLECRPETISDRINGKSSCGFSIDNAIRIKDVFFGEYNLEWLFRKNA